MTQRILIPVGGWRVHAQATNEQTAIRLTGRARRDATDTEQSIQTVFLTHDQAQELISELNRALVDLELHRIKELTHVAESAG